MTIARRVVLALACIVSAQALGADPLSLGDAVRLAEANSRSLARSELAVDEARAALGAATARFFPRVRSAVGAAYLFNPPDGVTIPAGAFGVLANPPSPYPVLIPAEPIVLVADPENLGLSASVTVEQTLFSWGKLVAGRNAAEAGVVASIARRDGAARDLRRTVTVAFAGVAAGRASLALVDEMVFALDERVADVQSSLDAGSATLLELLDAKASRAAVATQIVRAEQGLRSAEATLEWLVGTDASELADVDLPATLPDEGDLVARARESNPRLTELRSTGDQAAIQIDAANASRPFLPDLGLSVKAEAAGQSVPLARTDWSDSWDANVTITIGASVSLYDGGANRAGRESAQAQYGQALAAISEYSDSLPVQIRSACEKYAVAMAEIDEAAAKQAHAQEQYRVAQVSFQNELITRGDLSAARIAVVQARLAEVTARFDAMQAISDLEYLVGPILNEY